jgi:uncharacterized membrane protein SpoIIM required for sporulation
MGLFLGLCGPLVPEMDSSTLVLKSEQFRREREGVWRSLEIILDEIDKRGIHRIDEIDLVELPILYRSTVSSLSVARAISLDLNLIRYLEALSARSYIYVYGTRQRFADVVREFFGHRFPLAFYTFRRKILISAMLFGLGAVVGFAMTHSNAENYYAFVHPDLANGRHPSATTAALAKTLYTETHDTAKLGQFSGFLFIHNTRIGFLCFALGFLLGVPVVILIFSNGLMLGAFSALFYGRGLVVDLGGWLLPHGITEILALILCGGAGLVMGDAILRPGRKTRLRCLAEHARATAPLLVGAMLMLFAAGLLEGVFRQLVTDITVRYSVAACTALCWVYYLGIFSCRSRLE